MLESTGGDERNSSEKARGVTFVSHASEDKRFVKNLVDTLIRYGIEAWYDAYEIQPGMSIFRTVNDGLSRTEYGVVVLSHSFFAKKWPQDELAALYGLVQSGKLIPLLYGLSIDDLRTYAPLLTDTLGIPVPPGDVRQTVAPIARIILGTGHLEGTRMVWRRETLSFASVPLSVDEVIEDALFEDCVLQGPSVLVIHDDVRFTKSPLNGPEVIWQNHRPGAPFAGTIGLRRVTFRGCRFKNVGFVTNPARAGKLMFAPPGYKWPDHLQ